MTERRLPKEVCQERPFQVSELVVAAGSVAFLLALSNASFSHWVKDLIFQQQNGRCAEEGCNLRIAEVHHRVPENALRRQGIKGKDVVGNAVGLCFHHHKHKWDRLMEEGIFYPGVTLDKVDPDTYTHFQPRVKKHKRRR